MRIPKVGPVRTIRGEQGIEFIGLNRREFHVHCEDGYFRLHNHNGPAIEEFGLKSYYLMGHRYGNLTRWNQACNKFLKAEQK